MKDRETLKNLIQNSKLEEKELKNILFKTLQKTNDIIRVKSLMTEVLDGNLDNISDKDIKSLITVLGVEQFGKAIICRSKDKVIIPKTYYELREVK